VGESGSARLEYVQVCSIPHEARVSPRSSKADRPRIPPRPAPDEAGADPRERIIRTAYELFTRNGLTAVGVDRIVAEADVAKTTLYRHFRSKDDLITEVLERHYQLWLLDWLEPEAHKRGASPADRLLAVFETLNEWFGDENFQGCILINALLEAHDRSSAVRQAAIRAIDDVYAFLERLAVEANAREPEGLAQQLHLLVRGAIVAATQGRADAVQEASVLARQLVEQALPAQLVEQP
jgi:AcrR family transcriptional regulator